jgi:hypothetical protein
MSALPPIADIHQRGWNVRFAPIADIIGLRVTDLLISRMA